MRQRLDSLFSPAGEGARRADEAAGEAGLSNNAHASFDHAGIGLTSSSDATPAQHLPGA
ncbi:hypothetical protein [Rhizobium leguminosarum]|uniref:hypothetical protein n=1 Tax=Rhizobium leguminosarum TaxID=384 RepID=UPI001441B5DE|nr:hypothetical protein [Rhizobium leguminosarum]